MKFQNLGWIVAAGLGAAVLAGGFDNPPNKVGVVDMRYVFQRSDYFQQKQADLKAMEDSRGDLLDFIKTYQTITGDQANTLKTLSLKTTLTPAEKTQLDKLKADVQAQDQSFNTLNTKLNPAPDEVKKLSDFNNQRQQTANLYATWQREFQGDLKEQRDMFQQEVLDRVTSAVQEYAKKQNYTLVFANDVAPFGANDVTPDTLKVMNAKKQ